MPPKARIKGTKLSLTIGATEIHEEGTKVILKNEEASGDVTTFADAEAGGARQHFFEIGATQSLDVDSFWRTIHANTGQVAAYVYRPHGNAVPTPNQPHFIGSVKIPPMPDLGGEAGANTTFTFEVRLDCQEAPVMDTGAASVPVIVSAGEAGEVLGGALFGIGGSRFSTLTGLTAGGAAIPFTVITDSTISAYMPDSIEGETNLVATNGNGPSEAFTVTVV